MLSDETSNYKDIQHILSIPISKLQKTLRIPLEELEPVASRRPSEKSVKEKLEHICKARRNMMLPRKISGEQFMQHMKAIEAAEAVLELAKQQRDETDPYLVEYDADPDHQTNWIERIFGGAAGFVMIAALGILPFSAAMALTNTGEVAMLAKHPALALIYGVVPLVGVFSSIAYRDDLTTDTDRRQYDNHVRKLAMRLLIIWSVALGAAAFPIEIGGGANETGWNEPTLIATPMLVIFGLTIALDLVAGPALHRLLINRLTPRPIRRVFANGEYDHLCDHVIPKAELELSHANQDYEDAQAYMELRKNALRFIRQDARTRLDAARARFNEAYWRAAQGVLNQPQIPNPSTDDTSNTGDIT